MFLELWRVFSISGNRSNTRAVFEYIVLPFLVAAIMTTAYLARSSPDAYGEAFLFFGTLYAFWCGLFGSCQAFNGEVASGEWSFWLLGMNRNRTRHYIAHFVVSFAFAAVQVAVSLIFLWFLWNLGIWIKPIGYHFIYHGQENSFINQVGSMLKGGTAYNLQGLQAIMNEVDEAAGGSNWMWFRFCLGHYLLANALAVFAGVAVGLFVSAVCPTPQTSLTLSVFIIVSCIVFSHTGILGDGNDSEAVREFAPIHLILRQHCQGGRQFYGAREIQDESGTHRQTRWKDGGSVEQASFLLPQRYFFNVARIPCLKLQWSLGDHGGDSWDNAKRLADHATAKESFCKCPVCLGLVKIENKPDGDGGEMPFVITEEDETVPFAHHWIALERSAGRWRAVFREHMGSPCAFRDACRRNVADIRSLFALCQRMTVGESIALIVWCAAYAAMSLTLIHKKGMFNELR